MLRTPALIPVHTIQGGALAAILYYEAAKANEVAEQT
jgi:hypothetical protein